jgi:hypothetical protein
MTTNYTKRPKSVPNGHKIFQMVIKYHNIFLPRPSKFDQNWDFWFENKPSGNPDVNIGTLDRARVLRSHVDIQKTDRQNADK